MPAQRRQCGSTGRPQPRHRGEHGGVAMRGRTVRQRDGGCSTWYTKAPRLRLATSAGARLRIVPAAALRGFANSGSPASSRSGSSARTTARGRYTSPRTSTRPAGPPRSDSGIAPDRPDVGRHVLAARPVAARRAAHEAAVLVRQRDAQAVNLHLGDVRDVSGAGARRPFARARRTRAIPRRCRRCRG